MGWYTERKEKNRIRSLLGECMVQLSPYFEVSDEELGELDFPSLELGEFGYQPFFNRIFMPPGVQKENSSVGHETAHWFHKQLNREIWWKQSDFKSYFELIACWGQLLYAGLKVPGGILVYEAMSLPELVHMDERGVRSLRSLDFDWWKMQNSLCIEGLVD